MLIGEVLKAGVTASGQSDAAHNSSKLRQVPSRLLGSAELVDTVKQWATRKFKRKQTISSDDMSSLYDQIELRHSSATDGLVELPDNSVQAISDALQELETAKAREEDAESYHSATTGLSHEDTAGAQSVHPRDRPTAAHPPRPELVFDKHGNLVRSPVMIPPPLEVRTARVRANPELFEAEAEPVIGNCEMSRRYTILGLPEELGPPKIGHHEQNWPRPRPQAPRSQPLITLAHNHRDARPAFDQRPRTDSIRPAAKAVQPRPVSPKPSPFRFAHYEELIADNMPLAHIRHMQREHMYGPAAGRPHTMYATASGYSTLPFQDPSRPVSAWEEAHRRYIGSNRTVTYMDTVEAMHARREFARAEPARVGECTYVREQEAIWGHREDSPVNFDLTMRAGQQAAHRRGYSNRAQYAPKRSV